MIAAEVAKLIRPDRLRRGLQFREQLIDVLIGSLAEAGASPPNGLPGAAIAAVLWVPRSENPVGVPRPHARGRPVNWGRLQPTRLNRLKVFAPKSCRLLREVWYNFVYFGRSHE
jgi:hypothetical protein